MTWLPFRAWRRAGISYHLMPPWDQTALGAFTPLASFYQPQTGPILIRSSIIYLQPGSDEHDPTRVPAETSSCIMPPLDEDFIDPRAWPTMEPYEPTLLSSGPKTGFLQDPRFLIWQASTFSPRLTLLFLCTVTITWNKIMVWWPSVPPSRDLFRGQCWRKLFARPC